jgi:hypothetical protein
MMDEFSDELAEFTPGIENFYVQLGNTSISLSRVYAMLDKDQESKTTVKTCIFNRADLVREKYRNISL